jgi:hypothetical protein
LTGALVWPRSDESGQSAFLRFERQVGEKQQLVHYYHSGTELFPTDWEIAMANSGRTLLLSWKPEDGHTWAQVAAGKADDYIDREAEYLRNHFADQKFFLVIHHEPEDEVQSKSGSGYTAADYRNMYRHVVDRLRSHGVDNAVFVMCYMGAQVYATKAWFDDLWPGSEYVDWIGYDPYATPSLNGQTGGFSWLMNEHWGDQFGGMYHWITKNHPNKPIMLAEWGIGEKPGDPSYKADVFRSIPSHLTDYPALKALVYFDKPQADVAGDVQVDTSPTSLTAYRSMLAQLDDPTVADEPSKAGSSAGTATKPAKSSSGVKFVGATTLSRNSHKFTAKVPNRTKRGDTLLMFVAQGIRQPIRGPKGWARIGKLSTHKHLTTIWRKSATSTDAGSKVTVDGPRKFSKAAITVAAYRGAFRTAPVTAVVGKKEKKDAAAHSTPAVKVAHKNAFAVSFWSDKNNATTRWSTPSGAVRRALVVGSGNGRVSSMLADSGHGVRVKTYKSLTARADKKSATATMWTVILRSK